MSKLRTRLGERTKIWTLILGALLVGGAFDAYGIPLVASQESLLQSRDMTGPLPILDPVSSLWRTALQLQIPLSPQLTTKPNLPNPSVRELTVRSLNNGTWIAFLLEWNDATKNSSTLKTDQFTDGTAIQFPLSAGQPFVCMGQLGTTVDILHWKADWQQDIETFYQENKDAYPYLAVDYYPFATAGPPFTLPSVTDIEKTYVTGWGAGNPFSNPIKLTPVEELVAGGFGTLTSQPDQETIGRGIWENGRWHVVMARPMNTSDPNDAVFKVGDRKPVAFAVWDGGNSEVDGRKSVSAWITLSVWAPTPSPPYPREIVAPIVIIVLALAVISVSIVRAEIRETEKPRKEEHP